MRTNSNIENIKAKPFVKWAGGKNQLIDEIKKVIPNKFYSEEFTYIEPFVGGGAVFFWIKQKFQNIKKAVINDINSDLMNTYRTIQNNVEELIKILGEWEKKYHSLSENLEKKKEYYYTKRALFNSRKSSIVEQSALFIFLNKTCFNGLYRVNKKNEFNVPIGGYLKPLICDKQNLLAVNKVLENVIILDGDFEQSLQYAEDNTLFYFDPPYKPISETSSFNSYSFEEFDDKEQIRLAKFCKRIDNLGYNWILSNSDVRAKNPDDFFFEELFGNFDIKRVWARRNINANPLKRGALTELLITN